MPSALIDASAGRAAIRPHPEQLAIVLVRLGVRVGPPVRYLYDITGPQMANILEKMESAETAVWITFTDNAANML